MSRYRSPWWELPLIFFSVLAAATVLIFLIVALVTGVRP